MKELTDSEICVAIAKIDLDCEYYDIHSRSNGFVGYIPRDCLGKLTAYNPLTDDALCFRLMVKHKITMEHFNVVNGATIQFNAYHIDAGLDSDCFDMSPNKAICLAIIEAHKDN